MARAKALVLAAWEPTTDLANQRGNARRMRLFVRALARLDLDVTMAHFATPAFAAAHGGDAALERLQGEYWGWPVALRLIARAPVRAETVWNHYLAGAFRAAAQPELYSFAGPAQAAAVAALLDAARWDLVLVNRLGPMLALLGSGRRPGTLFFDLDDLDHRLRARTALLPPRRPGQVARLAQVPVLLAAERRGAAAARRAFVCSETDRSHLARFGLADRWAVVPNALPVPPAPPPLPALPTILLLGPADHRPNARAAERLVRRVLPLIRHELPAARVILAGHGTEALAASFGAEGVEGRGFVPDLDALYAETRLVCCPMDLGGGTRLKLVEAAGQARPIVATRVGAEGLDFVPEAEILLRESDAEIAAASVRLLTDDALAARLGAAARARMAATYDAEAISARIAEMFRPFLPGLAQPPRSA